MWLSIGLITTAGFAPTSGASWAEARRVAETSPRIAVKRIALLQRTAFNPLIISTLKPQSAPAIPVRQRPFFWLEIEIESGQELAGIDVCVRNRRRPNLMEQIEFVMPGKARTTRHERVIAVSHRVGGDVSQIRSRSRSRLLGHADGFVSRQEDKLRTIDIMGLDQNAIPRGVPRT